MIVGIGVDTVDIDRFARLQHLRFGVAVAVLAVQMIYNGLKGGL